MVINAIEKIKEEMSQVVWRQADTCMAWLWRSGEEFSSRRKNKCKGSETGARLPNLRTGQEANIGKPMERERNWKGDQRMILL